MNCSSFFFFVLILCFPQNVLSPLHIRFKSIMLICKQQITLSNRISVVAVELVRSRINCIMKWARSLVLSLPRAFAIVAFQLTDQCGFTDVLSKLFELERLKSFWPVRYRNGNQFFNIYKFHLGYVICHCISLFSPTYH